MGTQGSPKYYENRDPGPHFSMKMGTWGPQFGGSPFSHDTGLTGSYESTAPDTDLYQFHSLCRSRLWGTLSKAFLRSKNTTHVSFPSSSCCNQSWMMESRADAVHLWGRNSHCLASFTMQAPPLFSCNVEKIGEPGDEANYSLCGVARNMTLQQVLRKCSMFMRYMQVRTYCRSIETNFLCFNYQQATHLILYLVY